MRRLLASEPANLTINDDVYRVPEVWICDEFELVPGATATLEIAEYCSPSLRLIDIRDIAVDEPGLFEATTAESGFALTIRSGPYAFGDPRPR